MRAKRAIPKWKNDWNLFARDILNAKLDNEQQECLHSIQTEQRVSIRSGNARGKDFVAAVASVCSLNLLNPSKVIETAPTNRQAVSIMMSEIKMLYAGAIIPLGGIVLTERIVFPDKPNKYLMAFKVAHLN